MSSYRATGPSNELERPSPPSKTKVRRKLSQEAQEHISQRTLLRSHLCKRSCESSEAWNVSAIPKTSAAMASQCTSCDSWVQPCRCTKSNKVAEFEAHVKASTYAEELAARKAIKAEYPRGANACSYHRTMIKELSHAGQGSHMGRESTASASKVFAQSVTNGTALLPICTDCAHKEGVSTNPRLLKLQNVDTCKCATRIIASECWFCELARIEASKQLAMQERTDHAIEVAPGVSTINCECGRPAMMEDIARKCTGCGGVKSKPYFTTSGGRVDFLPRSTALQTGGMVSIAVSVSPNFAVGSKPSADSRGAWPTQSTTNGARKRTAAEMEHDDSSQRQYCSVEPETSHPVRALSAPVHGAEYRRLQDTGGSPVLPATSQQADNGGGNTFVGLSSGLANADLAAFGLESMRATDHESSKQYGELGSGEGAALNTKQEWDQYYQDLGMNETL